MEDDHPFSRSPIASAKSEPPNRELELPRLGHSAIFVVTSSVNQHQCAWPPWPRSSTLFR